MLVSSSLSFTVSYSFTFPFLSPLPWSHVPLAGDPGAERGQDASDASDDELMEPSTKAQWRFPEMGNGSRSETT